MSNPISDARIDILPADASFDFAIVGGGSAGCVLASRLSENPRVSVLLLESGDDVIPGIEPHDILATDASSAFNPQYRWPVPAYHHRDARYAASGVAHQAKVLGGGSAVMGMIALRGIPEDYNSWAENGAAGWSWEEVLPWFRKLERDLDFSGPLHGDNGPTVIRRNPIDKWPPLSRAMAAYAKRLGLPAVVDMNADFREGLGALPMSNLPHMRHSSSICYLGATVRQRSNLHIAANSRVVALRHQGGIFCGVDVHVAGGHRLSVKANETILSAGALLSPTLLMRAGIGPGTVLHQLGIPLLVDSPGVGQNLQNHPMMFLTALLPKASRQEGAGAAALNCCMRYSSDPKNPRSDLYINASNSTAPNPLGMRVATLQSYLLQPKSTGTVKVQSPDPYQDPIADFNFLSDPADRARARRSIVDMALLATSAEVSALGAHFFAVKFSARLRRLNGPGLLNKLASRVSASAYDLMPIVERLLRKLMPDGPTAAELLQMSDEALDTHALEYVSASGHHIGTCKMGTSSDPAAVVDPEGRVHGVQGLRVVDASIMPALPRGNTNLPTLMVAEKIADIILNR